jgi:hypothetical protein
MSFCVGGRLVCRSGSKKRIVRQVGHLPEFKTLYYKDYLKVTKYCSLLTIQMGNIHSNAAHISLYTRHSKKWAIFCNFYMSFAICF